uniref:Uncharacterized protein n=1 Tax=Arundo donax TaxID=35708 RepID=A0A0A9H3H9_ARUDO
MCAAIFRPLICTTCIIRLACHDVEIKFRQEVGEILNPIMMDFDGNVFLIMLF